MTDPSAPSAAGTQSQQAGATRAQDPPVMVAATVGDVTAVWQVEVDARVLLGDFSGAWLIDSDGVHGFAADADWIDGRDDREAVLSLILGRPVIVSGEVAGLPDGVQVVDLEATVENARAAVERNREDFAEANPGKQQPPWGEIEFEEQDGLPPQGLDGDAAEAVMRCMSTARGVRRLAQGWNAVEKLRVQRLGGELRALPLVLA
ncbi:N-acetylglucosamine-6-phosphate deacetylase [Corynebacterium sp.]|uniref:N-acetylglucosamine-6-phosphate deacetylase n=1 Tax=Corynebacterium sp. TaxID=1720 RepID=UPI0028AD9966|nr:N-acetylglucosamine-6-phosphate deacetylase [Corynebacterium sp.]